jgi:hypothetical protein
VFTLDKALLVAEVPHTAALLRWSLQTWPERDRAIAELILRAEQHGFVAWERVP